MLLLLVLEVDVDVAAAAAGPLAVAGFFGAIVTGVLLQRSVSDRNEQRNFVGGCGREVVAEWNWVSGRAAALVGLHN